MLILHYPYNLIFKCNFNLNDLDRIVVAMYLIKQKAKWQVTSYYIDIFIIGE